MPSCNARKIEKAADNRKVFKAFLTDLSKAFDCLPHELTTVKINADGLSFHSSKLINNYLWHRKQKVKKKIFLQFMGCNTFWSVSRFWLSLKRGFGGYRHGIGGLGGVGGSDGPRRIWQIWRIQWIRWIQWIGRTRRIQRIFFLFLSSLCIVDLNYYIFFLLKASGYIMIVNTLSFRIIGGGGG